MQIALGAVLAIAALWFVALRPKPSSSGGTAAAPAQQAPTTPGAQRAAGTSADGGTAASSGGKAASGTTSDTGSKASSTGKAAHRATPKHGGARAAAVAADPQVRMVRAALRGHKAIAIAFVAPAASDARAVSEEIRHVSRFGGRAVSLSVPISLLSRYDFITRDADVTVAPTTVIIAPNHEATTIVGFTDRVEIEQRLADALAVKRS